MKRKRILISLLLPLTAFLLWWGWPTTEPRQATGAAPHVESTTNPRDRRPAAHSQTLDRVRTAAQRKLPDTSLKDKDEITFAEIDPAIDELDVMEVLLEIETEFGIDIPQDVINQRIGPEHRRDLRGHLSLSRIAECVNAVLANPQP